MVISNIATFISTELDLVLGKDIWLHNIPFGENEGIAIKMVRRLADFGHFRVTRVAAYVMYRHWKTQEETFNSIHDLMDDRRGGISVDWSVSDEIQTHNYGIDENNRFVTSVAFNVQHT